MEGQLPLRAILGAGKVAQTIRQPGDLVFGHGAFDVIDPDSIYELLVELPRGSAVINTVAKINLEWCEENRGAAQLVNFVGAQNVLRACRALDLHLVHLSSGCIFDGGKSRRVYSEADIPTPACVYARTKAEADLWLLAQGYPKLTIARPRQLFSAVPNPTNMITKFSAMSEGRFIQEPQSATCIEDLGSMLSHLINGQHYGVFNCVNTGTITPWDMATVIRYELAPKLKVEAIDYDEYVSSLKVRRVNTLLSSARLEQTGFFARDVKDAFRWAIENYF